MGSLRQSNCLHFTAARGLIAASWSPDYYLAEAMQLAGKVLISCNCSGGTAKQGVAVRSGLPALMPMR